MINLNFMLWTVTQKDSNVLNNCSESGILFNATAVVYLAELKHIK